MPRVSDLAAATTFDSDDEFYVVQDGNSRKVAGSVVRGPVFETAVSTSSGSLFDFTGIPTWVTEVNFLLNQVSLSGTDNIIIQLGTSAGFAITGYLTGGTGTAGGSLGSTGPVTNGLLLRVGDATRSATGIATIKRYTASSNLWMYSASVYTGSTSMSINGGLCSLSANLDRVRITRDGGNTFDNGSLNVSYR